METLSKFNDIKFILFLAFDNGITMIHLQNDRTRNLVQPSLMFQGTYLYICLSITIVNNNYCTIVKFSDVRYYFDLNSTK